MPYAQMILHVCVDVFPQEGVKKRRRRNSVGIACNKQQLAPIRKQVALRNRCVWHFFLVGKVPKWHFSKLIVVTKPEYALTDQQFKKHIQKYAIGDVDKNLLPMLG